MVTLSAKKTGRRTGSNTKRDQKGKGLDPGKQISYLPGSSMKGPFIFVVMLVAGCIAGREAAAQVVLPSNPTQFSKRQVGENGGTTGSTGISAKTGGARSRTIVVQYVAVSPVRDWSNAAGKSIKARLLAFAAPKKGETGPLEIIRNGKVRFLLVGGQKPVDYPLAQLSQSDQSDIRAMARAAGRASKSEAKGTKDAGTESKKN